MTQIMAKGEEYSMHLEENVKSFAGWKVYRAEHRVQVVLFGDFILWTEGRGQIAFSPKKKHTEDKVFPKLNDKIIKTKAIKRT